MAAEKIGRNETVLLYHMEEQRIQLIRKALKPLGYEVIYVEKKDYLKPVGTLAGVKLFLTIEKEYKGPDFQDAMLVMAGMDGEQVDGVLKALRESSAGSLPYKAVLTKTNQFWTSLMLYEELCKEREAFLKSQI